MATKILLPRLGESVEEAAVGRWVKSVGDQVKRGEVIAELETAKAMMELESPVNGVLLAVFPEIGETIQMGELVAVVGKEGENWQDQVQHGIEDVPSSEVKDEPLSQLKQKIELEHTDRLRISPNARRVAREKKMDLSRLATKPNNERITADDIVNLLEDKNSQTHNGIPFIEIKPNQVERITAERMSASAASIPQFSLSVEVDIRRVLKIIKKAKKTSGTHITLTAVLVKAAAWTLKEFPRLNARYSAGVIECYQHANIAIAVATDHGLYVPVIHQADQRALEDIARKIKQLSKQCKDRTVNVEALSGGTFTISNLGMKGVRQFTPILDPSQSAILGVGEVYDSFRVKKNGEVKPCRKITLTLVCDHRVVDGASAADFMQTFKNILESGDIL